MYADSLAHPRMKKKEEVTLLKRFTLVALTVLVAALALASAAFAASDGVRTNYTTVADCMTCHNTTDGTFAEALVQGVHDDWAQTAHADAATNALPISEGPGCAGCHSGNYDPTKATPSGGIYPTDGSDHAFAEPFVGCSTCHYNSNTMHAQKDTLAYQDLANPNVCGQCHARYSQTVADFTWTGPSGSPTTGKLQYPVNYNPFTTDLAGVLNVASPGSPQIGGFWPSGQSTKAHGENAVQYDEMAQDWTKWDGSATQVIPVTHFNSLDTLKQAAAAEGLPASVTVNNCSHCMSGSARILADRNGGTVPAGTTLADLKYGDSCVACHSPHKTGTPSVFNAERDAQLIMPQKDLCGSCHNAHLAKGASFDPAGEVHHPQDEMMKGYGAVDVPQTPALHKGDCVQCHMVPTGYEYNGAPGTGANHLFKPIMPEYAATHTTNVGGVDKPMPNSSCSTCHGTTSDPLALRLQSVIDARQAWVEDKWTEIEAVLNTKAALYGYADYAAARTAFAGMGDRTVDQTNFLKAIVNMEFTQIDGSKGIHNFQYAEAILGKALEQANSVRGPVGSVDVTMPVYGTTPTIVWGSSTAIKGTVVGDAASLVGSQARLWAQPAGGSYDVVAQVFVISGAFSFPVAPRANTLYKVEFLGSDAYAPATSAEVGINVAYKVTLKASKSLVVGGTKVKLTGKVLPLVDLAGKKATIQRRIGTSWKTLKSAAIGSTGGFAATFKTARGTYKLRAVCPAGTSLVMGTSKVIKVVAR